MTQMNEQLQAQIAAAQGKSVGGEIPPAPDFALDEKFQSVFQQQPSAEEPVTADQAEEILEQEPEVQEEVEEETVTEEVEEPTVLNDFKDLLNTSRFNVGRADNSVIPANPNKKKVEHIAIYNWSLKWLLADYFRNNAVNQEYEIQGVSIGKSGEHGIWEEGGCNGEEGMVLIVTDPEGEMIPPNHVFTNSQIPNSKHALVRVWEGCHIVLGGHRNGKPILAVYVVKNITIRETDQGKVFPRYQCEMVAVFDAAVWGQHSGGKFGWNCAAIQAASKRMYEENALGPCYVSRFRQFFVDKNDYNNVVQDKEFLANRVTYQSVEEAYEDLTKVLYDASYAKNSDKNIRPLLYLSQNYLERDGKKMVAIFFMAVLFNIETKSSVGNHLKYGVTVVTGDTESEFYYPDKDAYQVIPFEEYSAMISQKNPLLTSFRLMY